MPDYRASNFVINGIEYAIPNMRLMDFARIAESCFQAKRRALIADLDAAGVDSDFRWSQLRDLAANRQNDVQAVVEWAFNLEGANAIISGCISRMAEPRPDITAIQDKPDELVRMAVMLCNYEWKEGKASPNGQSAGSSVPDPFGVTTTGS